MNIWIISDTHFGHDKIYDFAQRPKDFEQRIIKNWKKNIKENDLVIHLGDIAWKKSSYTIIKSLPGRKILVRGNHDYNSLKWYMENGFDFACDRYEMTIDGFHFVFTHIPLSSKSFAGVNVHGHLHNMKNNYNDNKHYLISLEKDGYKLLNFNVILKKLKKKTFIKRM